MKPKDILTSNRPPVILIYGPAGTWKTSLVSQLSGAKLYDFDDGMLTAAKLKDKFFDARQLIDFDIYRDVDPLNPTMFHKFRVNLVNYATQVRAGTWPFDAQILDSLTGLCAANKLSVMKNMKGDALAKPTIMHWGSMVHEIESVLTMLRSMNVLTIITAHVNIEEIDEANMMFPMSVTKKHGNNKLMWLFDEVWYASIQPEGQNTYSGYIQGNSTFSIKARTRSGIGKIKHNDIGMVGLLEKVGYSYGKKKE